MTIIVRGLITKAVMPPKRALGTNRLTASERQIVNTYRQAVNGLTSNIDTAALSRALSSQNIGAAVQSFDWGQFGNVMSTTRLPLLQQITQTGKAEAKALTDVVGRYAFDVTDPRATSWAAARSGELVVQISDQIRDQIRGIITSSFVNQIEPREVRRELEQTVGLFDRWANAVTNQYDRNVSQFVGNGMSLSDAQTKAGVLADSYRDRLIEARASNIARTEIMTAANQGRMISWMQAGDAGLIDLSTAYKEWIAEDDACPDCLDIVEVSGVIPVDEPFDSGDDMPPGHPSCRCTAVLVPADQVDPEVLAAQDAARAERDSASQSNVEELTSETYDTTTTDQTDTTNNEPFTDMASAIEAAGIDNLESAYNILEEYGGQYGLGQIPEMFGYTELPTAVSQAEFDNLIANGAPDLYRGTQSIHDVTKNYNDDFMNGQMFHGRGVYGDGTYTSTFKDTALEYGGGTPNNVMNMTIANGSKTIDHEQIMAMMYEHSAEMQGQIRAAEAARDFAQAEKLTSVMTLMSDPGRAATVMGYDAITVPLPYNPSETYYVILNRGVVRHVR